MSQHEDSDKTPPPDEHPTSSGAAPTQRLPVQGEGAPTQRLPVEGENAPASQPSQAPPPVPDPGATVAFTPEEIAKLQEESQAVEAATQEEDRLIGTLIRDKWKVLSRLGAGSFGTVYKVEDVKGGWIEALKILGVDRMTGSEAEEMRARFLREAQIMKRLGKDSKHIVGLSTYEEDIESGLIYFLMEFVEGRSLADCLAEDGPFTVERTVRLALQVCEALMVAHEGPEPVVHRDLKLENLMLTTDRAGEEIVKVLDFGIAKIAEREADSRLTTVGTLGTPGYAAPEQLRAEAVDGRTDLFAFGVILYALLTGRDPWLGNLAHRPTHQIYELMVATDRAEVRPMEGAGTTIPPAMVAIVLKLLSRNPDERFQSSRELRSALQAVVAGNAAQPTATGTAAATPPAPPAAPPPSGTGHPTQDEAAAAAAARPSDRAHSSPGARSAPRPRPAKKKSRTGLIAMLVLVVLSGAAVVWAQPWGRTLDFDTLLTHVQSGSVPEVWVTGRGLEGGLRIVPLEAASKLVMPFTTPVPEAEIPEAVGALREAGAEVDTSWEVHRITQLAMDAQRDNRYFGVSGDDVESYALRLEELDPESLEAHSLLLKVGERMAWDAEAAFAEGAPDRATALVESCLEVVPDHPRCLEVSESMS